MSSPDNILWSQDIYRENYIKSYAERFNSISLNAASDLIRTGGSFVYTEKFYNLRAIYWEILNDTVCFTEEYTSSNAQLCNNSVLVRVGASPILEIFMESSVVINDYEKECFILSIYIFQQDGNINKINIEYHSNPPWYSSLDPLVELKEGKLVYLGASRNMNITGIGYNRNSFNNELPIDNNKVMQNSSTTLSLSSVVIESIPVDRDIICATWISSSHLLVLGLSAGDILLVYLSPHNQISREQLLKDSRGSLVQVLWSEFIGTMPSFNFDTICVSSLASCLATEKKSVVLAVNRCGELRVWNVLNKQLILQTSISDLFETVVCGGFKQTDTKSSALLESCLLRLGFDQWSESVVPFNIGALAFLTSNCCFQAATYSFEPHITHSGQPTWQIILLAWQNTDNTFPGYGDKMRLIAKPITFPLCANQKRTDQYSDFLFKSANLIDLQIVVDSNSKLLTIMSVWRVVASRISPVSKAESKVVFESMMGKVVIPLDSLRSTKYESNCVDINELESINMILMSDSIVNERHRFITIDEMLMMQIIQRKQETECDQLLSLNLENTIKAMMMKRIFIPNRFSNKAIYMAYLSFKTRFAQILTTHQEIDIRENISNSPQQLIRTLPFLVLNICERIAKSKAQLTDSSLIIKYGKDNVSKYIMSQSDFNELLLQTFSTFLSECEIYVCRLERVHEGCLLLRATSTTRTILQQQPHAHYDFHYMLLQCGGVRNIIPSHHISIKKQNIFHHTQVEINKIESIFELLERGEMSEVFTLPFMEVDCLVFKYFDESTGGNQLSSNSFWINDFFRTLAVTSLQSVPMDVIASIRSLCANITQVQKHSQSLTIIDILLDIDFSKQTLQEFSSHHWNNQVNEKSEAVSSDAPTSAYTSMIFQLLMEVIRERAYRCKLTIIILFYLQEYGFTWLSSELYADIKNVYIPKAINQLLFFSLLLWFNNIRPVNNTMLRSSIEISSLFPLSSSMSKPLMFLNKNTNVDNTALILCDENKSVIENFIIYLCQTNPEGNLIIDSSSELMICNALKILITSLHPSVQGDFAKYLFCSGQYICLGKWATIINMRYNTFQLSALKDNFNEIEQSSQQNAISDFNTLMQAMVRYRILVTQLIAEYYEIMRCQWYQQQQRGGESMINDIQMKAMELMNVNIELENLSYVLKTSIQDAVNYDDSMTEMKQYKSSNGDNLISPYKVISNMLKSKWKLVSLKMSTCSNNDSIENDIEGCLVMRDVIETLQVNARKNCFDPFFSSIGSGVSMDDETQDSDMSIRSMFVGLCDTIYASASSDIIEILDRSSSISPHNIASSIVCNAIEKYINFISNLLNSSIEQHTSSYSGKLLQELYHSWSRIFEYLLVAGDKYEQSLEAIIRLAEVEVANGSDDKVKEAATANNLATWRNCLRALVVQACNYGKLDWLCSIPLNMTINYSGKIISLSDSIASTLEDLANTLDIIDERKLSYQTHSINYFECLYVYLLSRQNYREASRIMHVYNTRLETNNDTNVNKIRHSILQFQISTLAAANQSLQVLPASQSYILHCIPPSSTAAAAAVLKADLHMSAMIVSTTNTLVKEEKEVEIGHDKVELVDSNTLSLLFYLKYCLFMFLQESELLYNISTIEISSASECLDKLVLSLCSIGRYQEAISLTQLYDNVFNHYDSNLSWLKKNSMLNRSILTLDLTNIPIIALARESVLTYYSGGNILKTVSILKDFYLKCPLNPIMPCISFYNDYCIENYSILPNKDDIVLWRNLISILSYLQSASINQVSKKWYAVALRAGLNTVPNDSDSVVIPLSILDIYGGFCDNNNNNNNSICSHIVGDPSSLLLLLLEFRHLECACRVVIQMIKQYHEDFDNKQVHKLSHRIILPYTIFDQLIDLCTIELKVNNNTRLFTHTQRMKSLIEYHFSILCTEGL